MAWPLLGGQSYMSGSLITDFVLIQSFAYVATCVLLLWRLRPHAKIGWRFSARQNLYWLKQSYPFALLGILMAGYTKLDAVLLSKLAHEGHLAVGVYAAGYRLLDAAAMVPVLISGILLPQFASMIANQQLDGAFVRTAALLLGGLGSLVAGVSYHHAEWLMDWLYAHHTVAQTQVFQVLMCSFLPLSLNYVFGTLLTAGGRLKLLNGLAVSALLLNIALNVVLIQAYGALGAAWATLLTQSFMALLQGIAAWRIHRWAFSIGFAFRIGAWLVILVVMTLNWPLQASLLSTILQGVIGMMMLALLFGQPFYTRISPFFKGRFS